MGTLTITLYGICLIGAIIFGFKVAKHNLKMVMLPYDSPERF